ncbi:endo-1,3(4)-beta-glucanase [Coemansia spiralis]|nr:endo-1,3(4)-beta-glucanase [Coemansia spiralis]
MRTALLKVPLAAAWLLLHAECAFGSPAPLPDNVHSHAEKRLWMSTPEVTQLPAGIPDYYPIKRARSPQPPSGVHVPAPKDHPYTNEQDGHADFNRYSARSNTAPGYQYKAPTLQGVNSVLDPNKQSPLDTGAAIVYKAATSPYSPNGTLIDLSKFAAPLPTNKWWENLIIAQGIDPIHPYPYRVTCLANASTIGFPQFQATATSMTSSGAADWTVGDASGSFTKRLVTDTDALGVQVTWTGSTAAKMNARFYKGMPFVTYSFTSAAPMLQTIHAIMKVEQLARTVNSNGVSSASDAVELTKELTEKPSLTQVTLNDNSQWLIASQPPIQWKETGASALVSQASSAYTGFIQIAHLGSNPSANLDVLQTYAGTYPIQGDVTYAQIQNSQGTTRSSDVVLFYRTNTDEGGDSSTVYSTTDVPTSMQLLSFVLPHHVDMLPSSALLKPGLSGYRSAKGPLTAVAGNIITYSQPLTSVSFEGTRELSAADKATVQKQLLIDVASNADVTAEDPYFFGKGIAKVARLYQIAQEVQDTASASKLSALLVKYLTPWLVSKSNSDPLVYDQTWGGVVSTQGLADPSSDYGQGRYNDHHFHYGYFMYAGAVLAKYDINAFAPFREAITQLLRDFANPSYADKYFPYMRHFDPYDGHSWAAGLFTFGDGRNQESTGEAVNAYYGAYLLAQALGLDDTANFYEIVLNMEATSARRYWHPTRAQAAQLYMSPFIHNVVGILWSSKADYATFFGADTQYMYGIQMIPFTPATTMLLHADWVKEAWCPDGSTCTDGMKLAAKQSNNDGWAQLLYTAYSVVDRSTALSQVSQCTPDNGNTLTNVLHWIATCGQQAS